MKPKSSKNLEIIMSTSNNTKPHSPFTAPLVDRALELCPEPQHMVQLLSELLLRGLPQGLVVFVVFGRSGDGLDYQEWTVRAFLDKEQAEAFCQLCERETGSILQGAESTWTAFDNLPEGFCDPQAKYIDYPPGYFVREVPLSAQA